MYFHNRILISAIPIPKTAIPTLHTDSDSVSGVYRHTKMEPFVTKTGPKLNYTEFYLKINRLLSLNENVINNLLILGKDF